jgi:single-stranded-DNA-specific exonuclease
VKQNNSDGIAAIGFGLGDKIELTKTINLFKLFFVLTKTNGKEN